MAHSQSGQAGRSSTWNDMLSGVLHSLDEALANADAREKALPPLPEVSADSPWMQQLQTMGQRWHSLAGLGEDKGLSMVEGNAAITAVEESLRQHLATIEELRQRLEEWTTRAVG